METTKISIKRWDFHWKILRIIEPIIRLLILIKALLGKISLRSLAHLLSSMRKFFSCLCPLNLLRNLSESFNNILSFIHVVK